LMSQPVHSLPRQHKRVAAAAAGWARRASGRSHGSTAAPRGSGGGLGRAGDRGRRWLAIAGVDLSHTHSRDTRLDHKCRSWRPPAGCRQIGSVGTSHARCCLPRRAIETNFIHADFALEGVAPSEARRRLARPRRQQPPTLGAPTTTSDAWAAPATCLSQSRTGANWVMQTGS
jgi:hypothetical protein